MAAVPNLSIDRQGGFKITPCRYVIALAPHHASQTTQRPGAAALVRRLLVDRQGRLNLCLRCRQIAGAKCQPADEIERLRPDQRHRARLDAAKQLREPHSAFIEITANRPEELESTRQTQPDRRIGGIRHTPCQRGTTIRLLTLQPLDPSRPLCPPQLPLRRFCERQAPLELPP